MNEIKGLEKYRPDLFNTIYKENKLSYDQACETEMKMVQEYQNRAVGAKLLGELDRKKIKRKPSTKKDY